MPNVETQIADQPQTGTVMKVADLKVNGLDATESKILKFYARRPLTYAVYLTPERAAVHYADDLEVQARQRKWIVQISGLRNQIDGLIDGWRGNSPSKAKRYDGRIAAALILCLEGDVKSSEGSLQEIKADIISERQAWGTFQYFNFAMGCMAATVAILLFILSGNFGTILNSIALAGMGGIIGAFFSVAVGIRNRTVLTDLNFRDNVAAASVRLVIGLIAAWALVLLLRANFLPGFALGGTALSGEGIRDETILVVGFIAGFLERLVPDLLERAGTTEDQTASKAKNAAGSGDAKGPQNGSRTGDSSRTEKGDANTVGADATAETSSTNKKRVAVVAAAAKAAVRKSAKSHKVQSD